jgi:hypothetical protein
MLTEDDILSIVGSELSISATSDYNSAFGADLEASLGIYLGNPDGREIEGRSGIVSTDVADSIEWILPQIMKSFTQNNEVVIFDPVHQGDEKQAELESEYVYEVLMKQNDGFIILHQFVKDALMQRNGIIKVYYAKRDDIKISEYTGITEDQFNHLLSQDGVEMLEQSEVIDQDLTLEKQQTLQMQLQQIQQQVQQAMQNPEAQQMAQQNPEQAQQMVMQAQEKMEQLQAEMQVPVNVYDVKIAVKRIRGQIYVDSVPPEEFRLNNNHPSLNLDKARFTAQIMLLSASDIMKDYDKTKEEVAEYNEGVNDWRREYRFALQGEDYNYGDIGYGDDAERLIEVAECYIDIDIDETGISRKMKITTAGGDTPTDILSMEEIDGSPWVSTTCFLMSHKFEGLSITDRLKQIQAQKTALWRNMFDNMYLQNNQRNIVVENQVNLDDLLVSRPGGIIRAKRLDAITPLVTPQLGQDAYNMMEYLDRVRAGRSGVDADGNASPDNIGDRVGSEGVERMMNAKEELVGLIIRVVAETGIKPLCTKIRDLSVRHVDAVVDFRFRGQWYEIQPSEWPDRTMCTVRVGTGSGNHALQRQALGQVLEVQKLLADSGSSLVSEQKSFDTLDDYCKWSGLNGAVRYFVDPSSPEGQQASEQKAKMAEEQKAKDDKIEQVMVEAQVKVADAEVAKAAAQQKSVDLKGQVEQTKNLLTHQEQMSEAKEAAMQQQLDQLQTALKQANEDADRAQRERFDIRRTALELTRVEKDSEKDENKNMEQNKASAA